MRHKKPREWDWVLSLARSSATSIRAALVCGRTLFCMGAGFHDWPKLRGNEANRKQHELKFVTGRTAVSGQYAVTVMTIRSRVIWMRCLTSTTVFLRTEPNLCR